MSGIQIIGMGHAIPSGCMTNDDLSAYMETSDEWIRPRTGIGARRICGEEESQSVLAARAAEDAIKNCGIRKEEIGLIITATISGDYMLPSTSCIVQEKLGIPSGIPAFDVNAACTGFVYALQCADAILKWQKEHPESRPLSIEELRARKEKGDAGDVSETADRPYALIIGVEQLTKMQNYEDRTTSILFGDGAAAAIVRLSDEHNFYCHVAAEGELEVLRVRTLCRNQLNVRREGYPPLAAYSQEQVEDFKAEAYAQMDGKKIFRFATKVLSEEIERMELAAGIPVSEVDYVVCHQANSRIIDHVRRRWKLPEEKFPMNLDQYGNTSGASIPLVLYDLMAAGKLKKGTRIFCVGFGAGLTWAGACLEF
jgi:3-oxoacyl-[acyl-carrier-protein] synthase-3